MYIIYREYIRRPLGHPGCGIVLLESTNNEQTTFQHPTTFKNPISLEASEVSTFALMIRSLNPLISFFEASSLGAKCYWRIPRDPPLAKNQRDRDLPPVISRLGLQPNFRILEDSVLGAYVGSSWRSWSPFCRQHDARLPKNHLREPILEPTLPS